MECKKCGAIIKSGTYCMRCGSTQEATPEVDHENVEVLKIADVAAATTERSHAEIARDAGIDLSSLAMAKRESEIETGPITFLLAIIISYSFVISLRLVTYFQFYSSSSLFGLVGGSRNFDFRNLFLLVPVSIILSVLIKIYINRTYNVSSITVTDQITRGIFKGVTLVWLAHFLFTIVIPLLIVLFKMGDAVTTKMITDLIVEIFKTYWSYAIAFVGYLGLIIIFINVRSIK